MQKKKVRDFTMQYEGKIRKKVMGIRKKQCTESSYCLSVPLTEEQGTLQRRQTKKQNISVVRKLLYSES